MGRLYQLASSAAGLGFFASLFCYVAYATLGWSYETYEVAIVLCTYNYDIRVGLYKYYQKLDIGSCYTNSNHSVVLYCY